MQEHPWRVRKTMSPLLSGCGKGWGGCSGPVLGVNKERKLPRCTLSRCLLLSLVRLPAAPWSGSVFSAHYHVHQLVARVQQPRQPEGAAPAAAAAAAASDRDWQHAACGEQSPAT